MYLYKGKSWNWAFDDNNFSKCDMNGPWVEHLLPSRPCCQVWATSFGGFVHIDNMMAGSGQAADVLNLKRDTFQNHVFVSCVSLPKPRRPFNVTHKHSLILIHSHTTPQCMVTTGFHSSSKTMSPQPPFHCSRWTTPSDCYFGFKTRGIITAEDVSMQWRDLAASFTEKTSTAVNNAASQRLWHWTQWRHSRNSNSQPTWMPTEANSSSAGIEPFVMSQRLAATGTHAQRRLLLKSQHTPGWIQHSNCPGTTLK